MAMLLAILPLVLACYPAGHARRLLRGGVLVDSPQVSRRLPIIIRGQVLKDVVDLMSGCYEAIIRWVRGPESAVRNTIGLLRLLGTEHLAVIARRCNNLQSLSGMLDDSAVGLARQPASVSAHPIWSKWSPHIQ
ncbi:hypothetical protein BDV06DRAFT_199158 [Aspergillus oleicola]